MLSGGNEKKLRLWDLTRSPLDGSDASLDGVDEFKTGADGFAHAGPVKSACWDELRTSAVSYGDDQMVRSVFLKPWTSPCDS